MNEPNLYGQTLAQLQAFFLREGDNPAKAAIVFRQLYREGRNTFADMDALGLPVRQKLAAGFTLTLPLILRRLEDEGAVKYLLQLEDGHCVESVVMKHRYGWSLCLSCQVGCAMGCVFCASGSRGKQRDLLPHELTGQLLVAEKDLRRPVSALALMGMGEPFDNYDNVEAFLDIVTSPGGLDMGPRHITVSTCGLPEQIRRFARRPRPHNLCISLHAPNDELRRSLMPAAGRFPLREILAAARDYAEQTRQKVVFEYAMLDGVNDSDELALDLRELLRDLPCSVNLIPYNPTGTAFRPSPRPRLLRFYDLLKQGGCSVTIRREMGASIKGACGQLRAERLADSPLD